MTQEIIEVVRPIYEAWERGDFTSAAWAHPDIEFVTADGFDVGSWTGLAAMGRRWNEWLGAWEDYRVEVEEFRDLGDGRVLVLMLHCARGKSSGLDFEGTRTERAGANVLDVRDGKVTKIALYWDRERALADLGLSE